MGFALSFEMGTMRVYLQQSDLQACKAFMGARERLVELVEDGRSRGGLKWKKHSKVSEHGERRRQQYFICRLCRSNLTRSRRALQAISSHMLCQFLNEVQGLVYLETFGQNAQFKNEGMAPEMMEFLRTYGNSWKERIHVFEKRYDFFEDWQNAPPAKLELVRKLNQRLDFSFVVEVPPGADGSRQIARVYNPRVSERSERKGLDGKIQGPTGCEKYKAYDIMYGDGNPRRGTVTHRVPRDKYEYCRDMLVRLGLKVPKGFVEYLFYDNHDIHSTKASGGMTYSQPYNAANLGALHRCMDKTAEKFFARIDDLHPGLGKGIRFEVRLGDKIPTLDEVESLCFSHRDHGSSLKWFNELGYEVSELPRRRNLKLARAHKHKTNRSLHILP